MTSSNIEFAIWQHWGQKQKKVMCHNVSWGMFNHECDILVLENDNTFTEVEIKVSKSDIKKDLEKTHKHKSAYITKLYFAIPDYLYKDDVIALIPDHAGIIAVTKEQPKYGYSTSSYLVQIKRKPKVTKKHEATYDQIRKLAYLQQFRFWKERIRANQLQNKLDNGKQLQLKL